ncbi:MAG: FkbM family methyltransferase [Candidatus Dojkabacteria bacterium]|nr:MAG: FkbM family methyltransferase [Candidatus Dojkabacteria bacterium]
MFQKLKKQLLNIALSPFVGTGIGLKFPDISNALTRYYLSLDPKKELTVATREKFDIHVDGTDHGVGFELQVTRQFEPHVSRELKKFLPNAQTFVDVGANIGYISAFAASRNAKLRILSIEPDSHNRELLTKNLLPWKDQVKIVPYAVGDNVMLVSLSQSENHGAIQIQELPGSVQMETLDNLCADMSYIDLMKMDIEGYECHAIRGMKHLLKENRIGALIIECYPQKLEQFDSTALLLVELLSPFFSFAAIEGTGLKHFKGIVDTAEYVESRICSNLLCLAKKPLEPARFA